MRIADGVVDDDVYIGGCVETDVRELTCMHDRGVGDGDASCLVHRGRRGSARLAEEQGRETQCRGVDDRGFSSSAETWRPLKSFFGISPKKIRSTGTSWTAMIGCPFYLELKSVPYRADVITVKRLVFFVVMVTTLFPISPKLNAASTTTEAVKVVDGDTIDAKVDGVLQRVRILGINSTETGTCHAQEAKDYLENRIEGRDVKLTATDPSVRLRNRPARYIDLNGADIGAEMLERGLVTPYPHPTETARNSRYLNKAAAAKAARVGIWDDDRCGSGPSQNSNLRLEVRWDAEVNDSTNVNGEWIDIYNPSSSSVSLNGWTLRDPSTRFYNFPAGTSVKARSYVRVHVGVGSDTSKHKYWGLNHPIFDNDLDESVYLFDPDGDLRASFEYECRLNCTNEYLGLSLRVEWNPTFDYLDPNAEFVDVVNTTGGAIDLYGLYLESHPYAYHFEPGDIAPAYGQLRVRIGPGSDTSSTVYWGKSKAIFSDFGETVTLERKDGLVLEEYTWPEPNSSCSRTRGPTPDAGRISDGKLSRAVRIGPFCTS